ncbi:ABC transporter ATP-binding protein [Rothia koreensis]|jgi:ATP-binding cassette subfamily B multidrug efflux pump|uniref:ABC transporter ATP-binding protein n=1 Tax=Rothia koreensis TaxID=592378 RepID=UPI0037C784F3
MSENPVGPEPTQAKAFWPTALRLVRELGRHPWQMVIMTALLVGSVVLNVIAPRVLGRAMDLLFAGVIGADMPAGTDPDDVVSGLRAQGKGQMADMLTAVDFVPGRGIDFPELGTTLCIVLGMYVLSGICLWIQGRMLNDIVMHVVYDMRRRVEAKINNLPLSYFDTHPRGDILSRTTNDVDNVQQALQQALASLFAAVMMVIGVAVMMFVLSWQLALVALVAIPISALVVGIIGKRSQQLYADQWKSTGELNSHIEESFTGHDLITVYGRTEDMDRIFDDHNQKVYRASFKAQFLSGAMMPIMQFVSYLGYVGIAVLGGLKVASGQLSLGGATAFIQYSREFNQPLGEIAGMANMLQSGIASAERLYEVLDEREQVPDRPGTENEDAGRTGGHIEFSHVDFSYVPDRELIRDLSLTAAPGQTVAIVGPTGAGKTTLVNLILRFYDIDSGAILLDGVDTREMSRRRLRAATGMVLQDAVLFEGSIMENIRYGRLDATDEEVIDAAKATYVDRFVHALPEGYETVIDQEGGTVSAGERQLITIARAFIADPSVLILDEATSSVDTRTELLVQQAMSVLRASRTSFVIAHRLSTIRDADTIVVMEGGRIVEQGNHAQLIARRGAYHALYEAQFAMPDVAVDEPADEHGSV